MLAKIQNHIKSSEEIIWNHQEKSSEIMNKLIAKRISWPIAAWMNENFKTIHELPFSQTILTEFLTRAKEGNLIENQLKVVMQEMLSTGKSADEIIKEKWFDAPAIDSNELELMAKQILEENTAIVEQYRWGKVTVIWFFIGQLMKKSAGKANPKIAQEIFEKILE